MSNYTVAPLVGAWIEIVTEVEQWLKAERSLPSWERGLKFPNCSTPAKSPFVAPLVGAWIEIQ